MAQDLVGGVRYAVYLAGFVGESERVAPEKPLKRNHSCSHDREPNQGESGFATSETRVEEAIDISSGFKVRMTARRRD